jgi:hypothetical protein
MVRRISGSRFYAFLSQSYSRPLGGVHIDLNNSGIGPGAEGGEEENSEKLEDVQSAVSEDLFETNHSAKEGWEHARSRKEEKRREKATSVAVNACAANNSSKATKSRGKGEMVGQSKLPQSRSVVWLLPTVAFYPLVVLMADFLTALVLSVLALFRSGCSLILVLICPLVIY